MPDTRRSGARAPPASPESRNPGLEDNHWAGVHGFRARPYRPPRNDNRPVRKAQPFSAFERMVAFRYLRARRQEGFVSVIAIFSLLGIALGVATLIIVMSVMNGFRADLLGRILGLNGHLGVYAQSGSLGDFDADATKVSEIPGVVRVV